MTAQRSELEVIERELQSLFGVGVVIEHARGAPRDEHALGGIALRRAVRRAGCTRRSPTSVTHSGGHAFAVAVREGALTGIGIDFEPSGRRIHPDAARFFLTPTELASRTGDLLDAWTTKEAIFKADPHNADRRLVDYALDDWPRVTGHGRVPHGAAVFPYALFHLSFGRLAIAVTGPFPIETGGQRHACS